MSDALVSFLSGAGGAALIAGIFSVIQARAARKNAHTKALRYIMLYIIQERAKSYIRDKEISLEDRRALHHWHDLYHNGLGGNGDADALMAQVDKLPILLENEK